MKKTLLALLLSVAMVVAFTAGALAEVEIPEDDLPYMPTITCDKINYGTPKVDGKLDDIYAGTFQSRTSTLANVFNSSEAKEASNAQGVTYILWDEDFIYICTEVSDSTILTQGEDYIWDSISRPGGPWANDCVEMHIAWYGEDDDSTTAQKWGIDAYGYLLYTNYGDTYYEGYEDAYAKTSIDKKNGKYITEVAIPNAEGLGEGDYIGFCQQLNDIVDFAGDEGAARYACYFGMQAPWMFTYELVGNGGSQGGDDPTDAPTEAPTDAPTEAPTDAPTEAPTDAPTDAPTEAPTDKPTEAPTDAPTDAPTGEEPTAEPTEEPTGEEPTGEVPTDEEPTAEPTEAPTDAPTDAPTEAPTVAPTEKPTDAPVASGCGSAVISGAAVLMLACAAMIVLKKKD